MKEIIITSSVLILCIMLIRVLFKGKISGRLQYALWLLVVLRLIVPSSAQIHMAIGSIEEFRIMDLVEALEERFGGMAEQLERPVQFTMSLNSPLAERAAEFVLGEDFGLSGSADGPTSVFLAGRIGLSWLDILHGIWIGGMIVVAIWMIVCNLIFARRLRKGRKEFVLPEEVEDIYGRRITEGTNHKGIRKMRGTRFYTTKYLTSSCLYGIPGREIIYLTPDIAEDARKLRHVVAHEMCHKKHGDSFWAILRSVLLCVYWINPLVWVAAVLSKRDCELACDEAAILLLGEEERISYGETLLSIITGKSRFSDIACTATTMNGSGKSIKERIKLIAEKPKVLGAAVVAVLILVVIVSVFVFTKQPPFSGYTWVGEITLNAGNIQVRLPETIAGISGYDLAEDSGDIIIYHVDSGEEVGRFSELSYGEVLALLEEGREVVPMGNYGLNSLLKETDELPNEQITGMDILPDADSVTVHNYTSADGQTQGAIAHEDVFHSEEIDLVTGIPGTDSNNDDTTYMIEDSSDSVFHAQEESIDYLPNEQITTVAAGTGASSDKCYVYVKADYSNMKEKYLEEMEYINSELEIAAGDGAVISSNHREMLTILAENRTEYLGDASKTGALVNALLRVNGLAYKDITLHTLQTEPETALSLSVRYELTAGELSDVPTDILAFNAALLFATIKNLEECDFVIENDTSGMHYGADDSNDGEAEEPVEQYSTITYARTELEKELGTLWSDEAADSDENYEQWLEDLYARLVEYTTW
ncbi:MAG: DUF4825 domain-containing protein [Eubacterium sp.]|nr:DUF4825 domain-containing protein [Eubacterium sp.]